jgi:hypothetical protein
VGSSAQFSDGEGCDGPWPMTVCVPRPGPEWPRLFQPILGPDGPAWEDITTGINGNLVCGEVQEGSQPLLQQLGYQGYLGAVAVLELNHPVPLLSGWGLAALVALLAVAGALALRGRVG